MKTSIPALKVRLFLQWINLISPFLAARFAARTSLDLFLSSPASRRSRPEPQRVIGSCDADSPRQGREAVPSCVSHHTKSSTAKIPTATTVKIRYPPLLQPRPTVGVQSFFGQFLKNTGGRILTGENESSSNGTAHKTHGTHDLPYHSEIKPPQPSGSVRP